MWIQCITWTYNCIEVNKTKYKINYDKRAKQLHLEVGDRVLVRNESGHKLDNMYAGPFCVKAIKEPNVILFNENRKKEMVVHKNRLSKCN